MNIHIREVLDWLEARIVDAERDVNTTHPASCGYDGPEYPVYIKAADRLLRLKTCRGHLRALAEEMGS